jgi:hypothetical protein
VLHVFLTRERGDLWQPGGNGRTQSIDATFGRRRARPTAWDLRAMDATPAHRAVDRSQARREDTEAIARLVNAVTVETAFRSTVEEIRDGLTSPLSANEGVIMAAGPEVKPFEQPPQLIDIAQPCLASPRPPP